ncbi:hypothetical protein CcaverHIS002_0608590 [Cutaneotrichosporon cavernicola]|uniref:SGNH hydrolase-type esterase domain-containing protein n=1 Tax=Cutaneotrichosporon cavernicola TaxID=279322 RepID=A0AA48L9E6_9TREE|nr:uncharacterized protein CcaverHIS019_0608040 [Cutaneotrichosporon cavernicola]BEI86572.1 hypothetical protein CcaverHIS002_0608590 [Cutaneotrichosporon cavernicola]BEI94345.1 hypothetical protein CcaverHIS019_0608040 [Cutaneotrichosporon cavernicola]BEJ02122.1 hypothetical protein CcaverHIS631_0608040 [Cutaneotrichosporon cavernicola]
MLRTLSAASMTPLRILCFGDSLTSGWNRGRDAPYATTLEARVRAAFPDRPVLVEADGIPGNEVVQGFPRRMMKAATQPWDWILVLGGTNDLAYDASPEKVLAGLNETWSLAQSASPTTQVLALTIPEVGEVWDDTDRKAVNAAIMSHSAPRYHTFDFASALPFHSLSAGQQALWWDDLVHLTPAGYARMGELVGDALVEILQREA